MVSWGKKGKRGKKKEGVTFKKGKNASFWAINPPQTYFSGEKIESQKRGEGKK